MTGWIIFGGIVVFLVWLFTRSVTLTLVYENKLDVKVKFLFIKLFPTSPKKKKPKKAKTAKAKTAGKKSSGAAIHGNGEGSDEEEGSDGGETSGSVKRAAAKRKTAKKPKKKLSVDLEQIADYVKSASPPVKRLFRKIRFYDIYIDYVAGSDDAAKTALKYGGLCAAIYPFIEWLKSHFTVKVREINIEADFAAEKDDIFAYCTVKLRVSTALGCALWLLARLVKTYLRYNGKTKAKPARA